MKHSRSHLVHSFGLLIAFLFLFSGPGVGLAQNATPATGSTAHPVHIHEGSCDNLEPAPLFPLNDIVAPEGSGNSDMAMSGSPIAVEMSTTTIDTALADVMGGSHAINAHESAENIGNYIACGDIGGVVVDGMLTVGLHELNDSGFAGIAVLTEAGDKTDVTIYLAQGLIGDSASTPAAAAMDHSAMAADGDTVQVNIVDLAYTPATITIKAGQSVTWTNNDSEPHTVTARDREVLQSGTMKEGDTFTQQFDTPGTYGYFCEFHADMKGVIVVE